MTLWEHREACRRLRDEGRRSVDEHAIFRAVAEQRQILDEARKLTKAERRKVARGDLALTGRGMGDAGPIADPPANDPDAKVPMPGDGGSGVEFW